MLVGQKVEIKKECVVAGEINIDLIIQASAGWSSLEVLALLAQGKPNKLICRELRLSEGTVKVHVSAVLRALKVANRTQAALAVAATGVGSGRDGPGPRSIQLRGTTPRSAPR